MTATASDIFSFLDQHQSLLIERHEIRSTAFYEIRRHLRSIVVRLADSEDVQAKEICSQIRSALSEWLTVPVPFDDAMLRTVRGVSESHAMGRFGDDIQSASAAAVQCVKQLPAESPLRATLRYLISDLLAKKRPFKIYCHRSSVSYFQSLFAEGVLVASSFLHSVVEYRNAPLFDVLIKVGPLRSRGWGAAPDSLLSAPRFETLIQVIWEGCADEPDFGYDPVSASSDTTTSDVVTRNSETVLAAQIKKIVTIKQSGDPETMLLPGEVEIDEFKIFRRLTRVGEKQKALRVQIDSEHGILHPRYSPILSYDPADFLNPIDTRYAGDTLAEGMFLIRPMLGDIDLGGIQAAEGYYSRTWKQRLREELQNSPENLCLMLRNKGLDLLHLRSCLSNWSKPATGVIHAPQLMEHFRILIDVLAPDEGSPVLNIP